MKALHKTSFHIPATVRMIPFILLAAFIEFSCVKNTDGPGVIPDKEDREINFTIRLPYPTEPSRSRAITETEENDISSLYVLAFRENNNTETFDYWSEASPQEGNQNGSPNQNFSTMLKIQSYPQRLVLLANISDQLKQEIRQRNWEGVEKKQMLAQLEEALDSPDNKWNTVSVTDYRALPMWGESTLATIGDNTTGLDTAIPLLRMVARVDVQLDESEPGLTDKFRLGSVRLYNTNTKGRLVPDADNIQVSPGKVVILAPTIPAGIADYSERHLGPLIYEDFSSPGIPDVAMRNAIYLFETEYTDARLEVACLVIGGFYENDTEQTYYRVDFVKEGGQEPIDVLRNHKYTVNIVDVKQAGYKNPDDAFRSKGEGMDVSILHWNEIDIDEIWFDQIYYYSVSPRLFDLKGAASTGNRVRVETDYPEWSYKISNNIDPAANSAAVSWLQVQSHTEGVKYPGNGTVDYIVFNVASSNVHIRTAYIHVTAGRVTMTVTVKQTHWSPPTFTVTPTGMITKNGAIRTVTAIGGEFFSIDVQVMELDYFTIINSGVIMKGGNNSSINLTIPAWPAYNKTRKVRFEYRNPITRNWVFIRDETQQSFYWD